MKLKQFLLLTALIIGGFSLSPQIRAQQIPADENGRPDYLETKKFVDGFRKNNPNEPLKWEKHFLRAEFFLEGRVDTTGHLPVKTYWDESRKAIEMRGLKNGYRSEWEPMGPFNSTIGIVSGRTGGSGRLDCIEFHPTDPDIIYVGAPTGGLWKTEDGCQTWTTLTDGLPSMGISDVDLLPGNPETVFICTGTRDTWWETFSVGILRSDDGGQSWNETGLSYSINQSRAVHELFINPDNPLIMVAATSQGILRSTDGGEEWDSVKFGCFMDLQVKPGDNNVIYATKFTFQNGGAGIYKSVDAGETFDLLENTGIGTYDVNRITIAVTTADPNVVYALCSDVSDMGFYGLYRSDDDGANWYKTANTDNKNLLGWAPHGLDAGGQGYFTLSIAVSPANPEVVYVGGVNIWKTIDGGTTWTLNAQYYGGGATYAHADVHLLTYNPLNGVLYNANDGGLYKHLPLENDWVNLSDGLEIMQFYKVGAYSQDEYRLLGSPQDNGTVLFEGDKQYEILLAEACDNFFDHTDPQIFYCGGYASGLRRTTNGGYSTNSVHPPGETNLIFNPPFMIHPTNTETLYCAFTDAWRSDNSGSNWVNLTDGLSSGNFFKTMEVAPSNPDYIYIATFQQIWRTTDGGASWENIKSGLPSFVNISDITISTENPENIWITFSGFVTGRKVYHSSDAGVNWQNISKNLPNLPANCITYEPGSDDAIYVGTDVGIYYKNNTLENWVAYSNGLPNVMIDELEVHPSSGKILAATFGRGMWENLLADPIYVGVEETGKPGLRVFPNPATGQINIHLVNVRASGLRCSVFNIQGQLVKEHVIPSGLNEGKLQMDISRLTKGLYTVMISGEGINEAQKVMFY